MVQPDCLLLWLLELVSWSLSRNKKSSFDGRNGGRHHEENDLGCPKKGWLFFFCVTVFRFHDFHVKCPLVLFEEVVQQHLAANCKSQGILYRNLTLNWRLSTPGCFRSLPGVYIWYWPSLVVLQQWHGKRRVWLLSVSLGPRSDLQKSLNANIHHSVTHFLLRGASDFPPGSLTARPWKITGPQKERIVFQPSFFRGYVKLRVCMLACLFFSVVAPASRI